MGYGSVTRVLVFALAICIGVCAPAVAMNDGPALTRIPYDTARIPILTCSTGAGCELILQLSERLRLVSLMDDRWTARVADPGSATTAPRILIAPSIAEEPDGSGHRRALETALHAITDRREYVVDLRATDRFETHRLGFTYRDAPASVVLVQPDPPPNLGGVANDATPVPAESPLAETPPLDPTRMDYGWKQTGDQALRCVALFSYGSQMWCKLSVDQPRVPSAYIVDGTRLLPVNAHTVAERYVVIDTVAAPLRLVLAGSPPLSSTIVRARE
jgi:hypothetical protein